MLDRFIAFIAGCLLLELLYFWVARTRNIIDRPGARSSHDYLTFRGGGIVFPLAFLIGYFFSTDKPDLMLLIGLFSVSVISFVDDIFSVNSKLRLLIHSLSVALLILVNDASLPWYVILLIFVTITGMINMYNFMDGINGMTAMYSLIAVGSLFWVNQHMQSVIPAVFFEAMIAALLVFSFFNVRKKAICFAGDVGAVSMAFLICYMLLRLISITGSIGWVAFLGVYGIDASFTICCRIARKEPLMKAHRSHFYQYLANETKWTHLQVSALYAGIQLVINVITINVLLNGQVWPVFGVLLVIIIIYLIFRLRLEGADRLFKDYSVNS